MLLKNKEKATGAPAEPRSGQGATAILLVVTLVLLAGCATTAPKDDPVARRAQARWDMLIEKRFDEAYVYYSPGYRSTHPLNEFIVEMGTKRVRWRQATYRDKSCREASCTVRVDLEFTAIKPAPGVSAYDGKSTVEETWVQIAGEWWYVPDK